jgi:hypothetical protein
MKILGILLSLSAIGIGVLSLGLGVVNYTQKEQFFATAEQATGTITRYVYNGRSIYCVLIEFTTKAGQSEEYVNSADCPFNRDPSRIGKHVQVYYDPENPSDTVQVRGLGGSEGSGLIVGVIGCAIFVSVGLVGFLITFFLTRSAAVKASQQPYTVARGANAILRQDAQKYHANLQAAERARKNTDTESPADAEARLAQLKQQEEELQRQIDERRRQGH